MWTFNNLFSLTCESHLNVTLASKYLTTLHLALDIWSLKMILKKKEPQGGATLVLESQRVFFVFTLK